MLFSNAFANALDISAGSGAISATNAANDFSQLAITAGSANIRDANAFVLGATNITGAYSLQTAGAITQSSAVTVGGASTLAAGAANDITLNNNSNNFNNVLITNGRDVTLVDANALTVGTSSVRTINAKTLSSNLTLGGNVTATGSGTSILLASAQNFLNPGNSSLNPGTGRWLVYSTTPTSDTRGAGLLTGYNFKQYDAALTDTVLGTGNGFIYSTAALITASLSGTASKVYDGTSTASIASLTLGKSGMIDGDTVNISALSSATYDNKNVGTGKTVSSNTLTITSATNGAKQVYGYTLANAGVANGALGAVSQRDITAVTGIAANNKTYDGNTSATLNVAGASFTGIVSGETLAVGTATGTFNSKDVISANTVSINGITLADGTGLASNYNLTNSTASAAANITGRPITVTANTGQTKAAGTVDPLPFTYSLSGLPLLTGDLLSGSLNRLAGEAVGSYAINQGTLDAGSNYSISYVSNPFTIVAAKPSDDAGLVNIQVPINGRATSNISVLNIGETAAGNTSESSAEDSTEECKSSVNPSSNSPGASVMFNFGISLPAGVKAACI